ncbi:PQQ-dependent sugar dehydrogenase [Bradyrhizobium neotropicale]|uniref:PQQ-dependent sugar dehydrogenase n=1 Tax=Bradyrhizobium neotropicale TaxID=1497615 RepID=UPI001AD7A849|nr:PQQ-dependent sugar dehydrogenase [Bradyrhizobium neotropicale]MBO4223805.1 c-type cytochrome [Bradyrhizobium neotropicale]
MPVWQLPRSQWLPFACLATAFVASASIAALLRPAGRWQTLWLIVVSAMAIFGVVFLGLIVTKSNFPRTITVATFLSAVVLVPAPYLVGTSLLYRAIALGALLAAIVVGLVAPSLTAQVQLQQTAAVIRTEYYNLNVETYSGAFPKSVVRGGGLARIGDRYLQLSGDGHLYVFGWEAETGRLKIIPLPYRVPINGDEFAAAAGRPWAAPGAEWLAQEGQRVEAAGEVLNTEWFRTYALLVQETGPDVRVFVSHPHWKAAQQCWVERVSMLHSDRTTILRGAAGPEWKMLYETTPCLPVRGEGRRHGIPFVGYFGGGRMALLDAQTLLLAVGDFGFDGVASVEAQAQNSATSYGKTIAINIADGRAAVFTLGHRNPEGLFVDRLGTIWSTEHGPQGGDELNRLERGKNYGWPYTTDGTDYGSFSWPLNKLDAQQRYQTPVFAWVPSIATSNLLAVEGGLFPQWRGDLLIGSLKAGTLFRARVRDGHVAYLESIVIGSGIRDLIEGHDGRVILWTDAATLVSVRPKEGSIGETLFAEKCSGCHQSAPISGNRIGPNLFGVVGRRVASLRSYPDYSPALRQQGGVWTEARLDEFLKRPREACPGTSMDYTGVNDAERAVIIGYLGTLQ